MLKLVNVGKIYSSANNVTVGIRKVNLELNIGEFVAIVGESGSGKTTLLNVLSGIDTYEEGEMYVNGEETSYFQTEDLEDYRNKYVGFIFQNYNIIDSYTVRQNIEASLLFNNYPKEKVKERTKELIEEVGLTHRTNTKASKLSGGEKQRVVIARALAKDPLILAADEPTGNLDSESSKQIIDLLSRLSENRLVIVVTHNFEEVKDHATRLIRIYDSEVKEDRILKEVKEDESLIKEKDVDLKIKKNRLIPFSLMDLFSSPKRFIFNFIAFFVMSLVVLFSIGSYKVILEDSALSSYAIFPNTDDRRIIINKKDGTSFNEDDISKIKNINGVSFLVENDYLIDSEIYYFVTASEYRHDMNSYLNKISNGNPTIHYGSAPVNDNDVVLTVTLSKIKDMGYSSFDEMLGTDLSIEYTSDTIDSGIYKIVGIIDKDKSDLSSSYIYVSDHLFDSIVSKKYLNYYSHFSFKGAYQSDYGYYAEASRYLDIMYLDETLEEGHIVLSRDIYNDLYLSEENNTITLSFIDSIYGTLHEKTYIVDGTLESVTDYNKVFFSTNDYNELKNVTTQIFQLSIFVTSQNKLSSVHSTLLKDGYRAVKASAQIQESTIDIIISILLTIAIFNFLVGTFFIIFAVLVHSARSRSVDIEIFRTIGAKKKDLRFILVIEYLFLGLLSFLLSLVVVLVVYLTANNDVKLIIRYVSFSDYLVTVLVVLVMSFLLSLMFIRSIFKKSVKKGLIESGR